MSEVTEWNPIWSQLVELSETNPATLYRQNLLIEILRSFNLTGKDSILEVGCGSGALLAKLKQEFPQVRLSGIDKSSVAIKIAASRVKAILKEGDITQGLSAQWVGQASVIILSEVLEHLEDPKVAILQLRSLLFPDGRILVTVPAGPRTAFDREIGHLQHFSKDSLTQLLESSGFDEVRVLASGFPFFNLYRILVWLAGSKVQELRPSKILSLLFRGIGILFRCNRKDSPWGWQLVASTGMMKRNEK